MPGMAGRHRRHVTPEQDAAWNTEEPDLNEDGSQVIDPRTGLPTVTRRFLGTCGDCGEGYVVGRIEEPRHYVCPDVAMTRAEYLDPMAPCHAGCAIDCGVYRVN